MGQAQPHGLGVLNPAGHVVLSFPTALQAARAARALVGIGLKGDAVRRLSDRQMRDQLDAELGRIVPHARLSEEVAVARDHRQRAERGCHWLVVRASNDGRAWQVADCVRLLGVASARYYSHLIVQELLDAGLVRWRAHARRALDPRAQATAGVDIDRTTPLRQIHPTG